VDVFTQAASRPCFHELRTRSRLGYSVSLHAWGLHRAVGVAVRIQAPEADPSVLTQRIGEWLAGFRGVLEAMPEEELENHKRVRGWPEGPGPTIRRRRIGVTRPGRTASRVPP
jgi:secreted Zn-dependent insulinase-like peptidase